MTRTGTYRHIYETIYTTKTMINYLPVDISPRFTIERDNPASSTIIFNLEATYYQTEIGSQTNAPHIYYKLDNNTPADEIKSLLTPIVENDENSNIAREMLAMLYIREKDISQAKNEYKKIADSSDVSDELRNRALDMLNLLAE